MSESVSRAGEAPVSVLSGTSRHVVTEPSGEVPISDDPPGPNEAVAVAEPEADDIRYVAWTVEGTAHILDPGFKVARTYCGHNPKAGGKSQLKEVQFFDSPGNRPTCERCHRVRAARLDTKKTGRKGSIQTR